MDDLRKQNEKLKRENKEIKKEKGQQIDQIRQMVDLKTEIIQRFENLNQEREDSRLKDELKKNTK